MNKVTAATGDDLVLFQFSRQNIASPLKNVYFWQGVTFG